MTAIEFRGDIFILDCGFAFSEGDTPGIDYNILTGRKEGSDDRPDREQAKMVFGIAKPKVPDRHHKQRLNDEQPRAPLAEHLGQHRNLQPREI